MIKVTYEYPTANGNKTQASYICETDEHAEIICKEVERRTEIGYKIVDVTRE